MYNVQYIHSKIEFQIIIFLLQTKNLFLEYEYVVLSDKNIEFKEIERNRTSLSEKEQVRVRQSISYYCSK